jgi:uridylate kinase
MDPRPGRHPDEAPDRYLEPTSERRRRPCCTVGGAVVASGKGCVDRPDQRRDMNEQNDAEATRSRPSWKRIVFKPSGEALAGSSGSGLDGATLDATARDIIDLRQNLGVDVAVVVGGGNFWRGRTGSLTGMDATQSDHIGMLGTVMNALALQDALERLGQDTRVQSAIEMPRIAEAYIRRRAVRHLEKGRVVIFAAGTGNPFFTTDTAAALRAAEIEAEVLIKGTHSGVDGIYSADPRSDASATKYDEIGYLEVMTKDLKVMDATAIAFCRDNDIPIVVFDMSAKDALRSILTGGQVGTIVH